MGQYIIDTTAFEDKILENDLIDIDVFFQNVKIGKIHKSMKRMAREEQQKLIDENALTGPVKLSDLAQAIMDRPGYENRKDKDAKKAKKNGP